MSERATSPNGRSNSAPVCWLTPGAYIYDALEFLLGDRTKNTGYQYELIHSDTPAKATDQSGAAVTQPINRRRWFRFRLRTLLLAMTVLCIWLGFKVNAAREQRQIVKLVQELGGTVWYDFECDSTGGRLNPPPEPGWLANLVGVDFLHDVFAVRIINSDHQKPKNYRDLMSRLRGLPKLRDLVLTFGTIRDEDFQYLVGVRQLIYVGLIQNEITGEGVRFLRGAKQLKMLFISSNSVNDDGLDAIAAVPNLQWLRLLFCGVTDARLNRLKPIASLEKIELSGTTITDASIDTLLSFSRLKDINLIQTGITPDGVKRLQQSRPSLRIVYH